MRPNTKAFFGETISNPQIDILDTPAVGKVAHANGVPLTGQHRRDPVPDPALAQAGHRGASATKYLGGHGTAIAGVIVDGGTFDWTASGKFPGFTTPDPSYHGVVFADLGAPRLRPGRPGCNCCATSARRSPPFNAFLIAQGLGDAEPAHRTPRRQRPAGGRVPRRPRRCHQRQLRWAARLALVSSGRKRWRPREPVPCCPSNWPAVWKPEEASAVDGLELHSHVANIGDVCSLVIHPAPADRSSSRRRSSAPAESSSSRRRSSEIVISGSVKTPPRRSCRPTAPRRSPARGRPGCRRCPPAPPPGAPGPG